MSKDTIQQQTKSSWLVLSNCNLEIPVGFCSGVGWWRVLTARDQGGTWDCLLDQCAHCWCKERRKLLKPATTAPCLRRLCAETHSRIVEHCYRILLLPIW